MDEKARQFVEHEFGKKGSYKRGINVGIAIAMLGSIGLKAADRIIFGDTGADRPISIERVVDVDAENLEELNLARGTIVYNDTEDTYLVYLDDTEANPAQEVGWYEIDLKEAPIVPEGK